MVIWDISDITNPKSKTIDNIKALAVSSTGTQIATISLNNQTHIIDTTDIDNVQTYPLIIPAGMTTSPNILESVMVTPDFSTLVFVGSEELYVWYFDGLTYQMLIFYIAEQNVSTIRSVALSHTGKRIITGTSCGTVRVWDLHDPLTIKYRFLDTIPNHSIKSVAINADGTEAAVTQLYVAQIHSFNIADLDEIESYGIDGSRAAAIKSTPSGRILITFDSNPYAEAL